MSGIESPKIPEEPPPVLGQDELRQLLKACEGKDFAARRDTAIIRLLLDTGSPSLVPDPGGCRCWTAWIWWCAGSFEDVRGKFPDSPVLFADESGGSLHPGTIRNRLRYPMELEGRPVVERFSPQWAAAGVRDPPV